MANGADSVDRETKRFLAIEALVVGTLFLAFLVGNNLVKLQEELSNSEAENYTVKELLNERPLGRDVVVWGNFARQLEDYRSQSGNLYQQFYISSGDSEVLVFCNTEGGRFNTSKLEEGDEVKATGEFKEHYGQLEIYTYCSSVSVGDRGDG